ncbi:hypothetical protein SLA2020_214900 [Shorea laevis]
MKVAEKKNNLVELFGDGGTDDTGVKSRNINGDKGSEGFGSPVRLNHIPEKGSLPLGVKIVGVFSPEIARHLSAPSLCHPPLRMVPGERRENAAGKEVFDNPKLLSGD